MRRLAASSLCLLALAAAAPAALAQSAGDDQYGDPFEGQEQAQGNPGSSQKDTPEVVGQTDSGSGSPAASSAPAAQSSDTATTSGSGSRLAYTGYPAVLVALLGAFVLAAGLMIRANAARPSASRRAAVLVLGRDVRLAPPARRR